MRIVLVNRFYGGESTPTGRMVRDVAEALVAEGHDVRVLASDGQYAGAKPSVGASGSVAVTHLKTPNGPRLADWTLFWLQAFARLPFMTWDRCVLLTDPPFMIAGAALLGRLLPERKIYWWTMDLYPEAVVASGRMGGESPVNRLLRRANEAGLRQAEGVVCLGHCQKERLARYPAWRGVRHRVVPPWDDRPLSRVSKKENRFLERYGLQGKRVVLYAGNLGEAHSFEETLAAARLFHARGDDEWAFVFVARGAKRAALEAASARLPNVRVLDYQPPDLTADLLWAADVHLITMEPGWEGIVVPSKLYGVLKTEAPVLFIGPPEADTAQEIRQHGAGRVLPSGAEAEAVAQALERLYAEGRPEARRNGRAGAEAVARFVLEDG